MVILSTSLLLVNARCLESSYSWSYPYATTHTTVIHTDDDVHTYKGQF